MEPVKSVDEFDLNIGKPVSYHLSCQSDKYKKPSDSTSLRCGVVFYSKNGETSFMGKYKVSKGYIFVKDPSNFASSTTAQCGQALEFLMGTHGTENVEFSEFVLLNGKLRHFGSKGLSADEKKRFFSKTKAMSQNEKMYLKTAFGLVSGFLGMDKAPCRISESLGFRRTSNQNVSTTGDDLPE